MNEQHPSGFKKARDLAYVLLELATTGQMLGQPELVEAARATVSLRPHPLTSGFHSYVRQAGGGIFYTLHTDNELLGEQLNDDDCFFVRDAEREQVAQAFVETLAEVRHRLDAIVAQAVAAAGETATES